MERGNQVFTLDHLDMKDPKLSFLSYDYLPDNGYSVLNIYYQNIVRITGASSDLLFKRVIYTFPNNSALTQKLNNLPPQIRAQLIKRTISKKRSRTSSSIALNHLLPSSSASSGISDQSPVQSYLGGAANTGVSYNNDDEEEKEDDEEAYYDEDDSKGGSVEIHPRKKQFSKIEEKNT